MLLIPMREKTFLLHPSPKSLFFFLSSPLFVIFIKLSSNFLLMLLFEILVFDFLSFFVVVVVGAPA